MSSVMIAQLKERNTPVIVANHAGNVVEGHTSFAPVFGWSIYNIIVTQDRQKSEPKHFSIAKKQNEQWHFATTLHPLNK